MKDEIVNINNFEDVTNKQNKVKKKSKILFILVIVLDLIALFCLLMAYGPNKTFKNFLVTTAMSTMNHKYLARTIYSDNTIKKVLEENCIVELNEKTNTDSITIGNYETSSFESKYEEQILKKDNSEIYKIIKIKEEGRTFYLTVVYDPSRISLVESTNVGITGETVKNMAYNNSAILGINAGGFEDYSGTGNGARATGTVIRNGKITWVGKNNRWGGGLVGFNKEYKLVLTKDSADKAIKDGMVDAVTFGPFLIVNGKESIVSGNGGSGKQPRTVIAQRKDGIVLFLVIDGNGNKTGYRGGADFNDIITILKRYKAYNAANLDGGASSILLENNNIVNNPVGYGETGERNHPNAWIVK